MTGGRGVPGLQPPVPDGKSTSGSADQPAADRHTASGVKHPACCDPAGCTAVAASAVLDSRLAGSGGQHRSAPIPVDLSEAIWLPQRTGTGYLTGAAAPWPGTPDVHIRRGQAELSLPSDAAGPVLAALCGLVASGPAVIR
jgi:hypothetical protein